MKLYVVLIKVGFYQVGCYSLHLKWRKKKVVLQFYLPFPPKQTTIRRSPGGLSPVYQALAWAAPEEGCLTWAVTRCCSLAWAPRRAPGGLLTTLLSIKFKSPSWGEGGFFFMIFILALFLAISTYKFCTLFSCSSPKVMSLNGSAMPWWLLELIYLRVVLLLFRP